jgi:hypothetical protein
MSAPSTTYDPRRPAQGPLYQIVHDHFETFRAQASTLRDGEGLPRFVEQEFRDYLTCGCLACGFARLRCDTCGHSRLVPFSCKGRGFCPSCGGRRMAERAAHLVDRVFPDVPVRQWVLSLPHRLRYLPAWDHELCRAVVGVYIRAVLGWLRQRARRDGVADGRGGAVAIVQRFGGALNLNVHVHALVLDGVFAGDGDPFHFHAVHRLTRADVAGVAAIVADRVERLLQRRGLGATPEEGGGSGTWADEAPESIEPLTPGPCHARCGGFDLHAGIVTRAGQRERLERLCRYVLRPPIAQDRLRLDPDGQVWLELRHRWSDGTTHLKFDPVDLLGRLAALTPRPRINLVLYYGVLAPRAACRAVVVGSTASQGPHRALAGTAGSREVERHEGLPLPRARAYRWADLMRRTFGFDVLACPRCGGRLCLLALIEQASVVERILRHLGLPTELPQPWPARAPPALTEPVEPFSDGVCPD